MSRLVYRPLGVVAGVAAGGLAGVLFKQAWRVATGQSQAPKATDKNRGWTEILIAATVQGAVFALVKAAVDRSTAVAVKQLTGDWPE